MTKNKTEPLECWGLRAAGFYAQCEGEPITVVLLTGERFDTELLGVDRYDLLLQGDGNNVVLVPKHAIAYVLLYRE